MPAYLPQLAFQPYITPIKGEPIQEISALGNSLNQRYEDNLAKYDALDSYINQIQVNDADAHLKEGLIKDTRNAISNIAQNGDWENAKIPVREVAKRLNNDAIINKAKQNYLTVQELDKQRLKAAEEGKPLIQFQDYKNFSTIDPATGKARDIPLSGIFEQKLDTLQKMREIFADVNPDSYAHKNSSPILDEESGQIYQIGSGASKRYLSKEKLKEVANRSFDNFLNTTEGRQRLKVLTTSNSENPVALDTKRATQVIKDELLNVGLNKAFSDSSSESTSKLVKDPNKSGKNPKDTSDEYRLTQDDSYQQNQNLDGLLDAVTRKTRIDHPIALFGVAQEGTKMRKNDFGEIPKGMENTYNSLKKMFSASLGTNDINKINPQIEKYITSIKNGKVEPKYFAYNKTEKINAENNFVKNGNLDGRIFLDPETHDVLTWKQIKDKYKNEKGNKISDSDVENLKVSGEYSEDNPFVEMTGNNRFVSPQKLTIGGKKFIMGSDVQEMNSPNFVLKGMTNGITRATRTGLPVKFNKGLSIIPKGDGFLIQDHEGKLRGLDASGTPFSLEDAQKLMLSTGNVIPQ